MEVNQMEAKRKLESLEHRISQLKQRIDLQKVGPDVDTARKILSKLEIKYKDLQKQKGIIIAEVTSVKRLNALSEEELIKKLGAIYWIFGPCYEDTISYKRYRIEFLRMLPNNDFDFGCLMKVQVHIYENDKPFLIKDTIIEFWKGWKDSAEVDDVAILSNETVEKYNTFHWFHKIGYTLAKTWNDYFQAIPLIEAKNSKLIEADDNGC